MARVVAYVDGFNLYNGLKAKHGKKYLWLNLELLVARLLQPYQQLEQVRYFTASVRDDPAALHRQSQYLGALVNHAATVEVTMGRFQEKTARCRTCRSTWTTYEEKETDVNIAISLLEDGIYQRFDTALIISGDSDLCPPIRALRRVNPGVRVVSAFPPKRASDELRRTADAAFMIGDVHIRNSLLPPSVRAAGGLVFTRPRSWF